MARGRTAADRALASRPNANRMEWRTTLGFTGGGGRRFSCRHSAPGRACHLVPLRFQAGQCTDIPSTGPGRSEEHTSELQSLMRISYAVFCLKKKKKQKN